MNKNILFVLMVISTLFVGCTGLGNIEDMAASIPQVQELLDKYPGAEVNLVYYAQDEVSQIADEFKEVCEKEAPQSDLYKLKIMKDGELFAHGFLTADYQLICLKKIAVEGEETPEVPGEGAEVQKESQTKIEIQTVTEEVPKQEELKCTVDSYDGSYDLDCEYKDSKCLIDTFDGDYDLECEINGESALALKTYMVDVYENGDIYSEFKRPQCEEYDVYQGVPDMINCVKTIDSLEGETITIEKEVEVEVPVEGGDVEIKTEEGSVEVKDGNVEIKTEEGSVEVKNGNVEIKTEEGSVEVKDGNVEIKTEEGSVEVKDGNVEIKTNNETPEVGTPEVEEETNEQKLELSCDISLIASSTTFNCRYGNSDCLLSYVGEAESLFCEPQGDYGTELKAYMLKAYESDSLKTMFAKEQCEFHTVIEGSYTMTDCVKEIEALE